MKPLKKDFFWCFSIFPWFTIFIHLSQIMSKWYIAEWSLLLWKVAWGHELRSRRAIIISRKEKCGSHRGDPKLFSQEQIKIICCCFFVPTFIVAIQLSEISREKRAPATHLSHEISEQNTLIIIILIGQSQSEEKEEEDEIIIIPSSRNHCLCTSKRLKKVITLTCANCHMCILVVFEMHLPIITECNPWTQKCINEFHVFDRGALWSTHESHV